MSFNLLAILLAAISSMVIGTIWYQHAVFGRKWMSYTSVDPLKPKKPAVVYSLSFVSAVVTAVVLSGAASLAHAQLGLDALPAALASAAALWLGFTAATSAVHYLFEGRQVGLFAISVGHQLVTSLLMAVILGLFGF